MSPFTISQLWQDVYNVVKVYSVKHTENPENRVKEISVM